MKITKDKVHECHRHQFKLMFLNNLAMCKIVLILQPLWLRTMTRVIDFI